MKRIFAILVVCLLILTGCSTSTESSSSQNTDEISEHNADIVYTMLLDDDSDEFAPYLSLDENNNTFVFTYDVLSSYMPTGTYEIKDGILTAYTDDGKYTYLFSVIDDNTIEFIQDGSSEVKLTDDKLGVSVYDGAQFKAEK